MSEHAQRPSADEATESERLHADLDALAGSWVEDPGFDEAILAQDQVDEELWR